MLFRSPPKHEHLPGGVDPRHVQRLLPQRDAEHGKDRVFGVPLWQEALDVTGIDATRQVLMLGRDFSDCWNLTRLCDLIMLHERRSGTFMACSLLSRGPAGRTLFVTAPVSDVFAGGATRLVPLFTGILTSAEPAVVSDGMETWSVEFRELAGAQPALGALPNAPSGTGEIGRAHV